jgi:NAD-dependent DNA ligase
MSYKPHPGETPDQTRAIYGAIKQRSLTKAAQTLMGICAGITADGVVHAREVQFLSTWLAENAEAAAEWPGSEISRRVKAIMADGIVTDEERADLLETLQQLCGTYFSETGAATAPNPTMPLDDDPSIFFRDMTYCFTGRFIFGTRAACERRILRLGGTALDNVSNKLNYLVIGTLIEPQWINTTYGRKIEKAVKIREESGDLTIISERQWTAALADAG